MAGRAEPNTASMPEWPAGRSRHGGVDEVTLPVGPGRLRICGKHFVAPDPERAMARSHTDLIVCLCERHELDDRYPSYVDWLETNSGSHALWHPIPDLHAPPLGQARALIDELLQQVGAGRHLLMHCGAGIGRAGTFAAGMLIRSGCDPAEAVATVARARPMAGPEAGAQADLLADLSGDPLPG
jgi:Swiss Army Knife protein, DSP-PTPase phosphatase domain